LPVATPSRHTRSDWPPRSSRTGGPVLAVGIVLLVWGVLIGGGWVLLRLV